MKPTISFLYQTFSLSLALAIGLTAPIAANATASPVTEEPSAQLWARYETSAREIRELSRKLNTRGIVQEVNTTLNKAVKETVAEKRSESSSRSASGGLFGFLFSLSANYGSSKNKSWDVSKMIVQSPAEVANFDRKEAEVAESLRSNLLKYVEKNERRIIRLKELAVLNLAAAHALIEAGENVPRAEVDSTAALAKELNFAGRHNVTRCVTTAYAARSSSSEDSQSAGASGWLLLLSFNLGGKSQSNSYWEQLPHDVTECQSATNHISVTPDSSVYVVSLSRLDRMIDAWQASVELAYLKTPAAPAFPTWGSPYYQ